jgi:two-component system, cell cycle response regulator
MTVSIGIAMCGEDDMTIERALSRADRALYAAKSHGRNRVEIFDETVASTSLAG